VDTAVATFGRLDILVNAAQHTTRGGSLLTVSDEDVDALWRSGPLATLRLMRLCHPHLRGGGVIINFGSGAQWTPEQYAAYAATKEAISALTRAAAVEWGPHGIRVHLIVPWVLSPSARDDLQSSGRLEEIVAKMPIGRVGRPSDVGEVAVFLAGPGAAYLTGQTLMVDGGMIYHR
jgi:NAD(P)-dependent dehydrogenase (short-subunit alcohol dehydrogenase family)